MTGGTLLGPAGHYRLGLAMAAGGGVCLSFGGLILRHIETGDGWQILVIRSLAFALTLLLYLLVRYRGALKGPMLAIGWDGLLVVPILGLGFVCYLFGLVLTSVANVVFIVSTAPFFAALIGWLVLRERVGATTGLAIAVALGGVALMVAGGLGGGPGGGGLTGMLVALGAPISFALLIVVQRRRPADDLVPAVMLSGLFAALLAAALVEDWTLSPRDVALSALMGVVQIGFGFLLITLGARWLPAAQTALLTLSEAVLAPFWVWLFLAEQPASTTLLGGALILGAVAGPALWELSRGRARAA